MNKTKSLGDNIFNVYSYKGIILTKNLVDCFRHLGMFKEAEENCNIGLSEKPNDDQLLFKKGKNINEFQV